MVSGPEQQQRHLAICLLPGVAAPTIGLVALLGLEDGTPAPRDQLCLTISFDHNVVDGAPAARFTERLKGLVESGYGLPGAPGEPDRTGAPGAAGEG